MVVGRIGELVGDRPALIHATRIPAYRDVLSLYHWQALSYYTRPDITHHGEIVNGWQHLGHLHARGIDQVHH